MTKQIDADEVRIVTRNLQDRLAQAEQTRDKLAEAARRVLQADIAAENGAEGADQEWDESLEALRLALAGRQA